MADRNGSLETNESSSPETSHEEFKATPRTNGSGRNTPKVAEVLHPGGANMPIDGLPGVDGAQFDFNDLFNLDNIPGLSVSSSVNKKNNIDKIYV